MSNNKECKRKFRSFILIVIFLVVSVLLAYKGFYLLTTSKTERDLKRLKYADQTIDLIIENQLDKFLINNGLYSKTLEVALVEGQYEKKLLEEYLYFPHKEYDSFINQLNELNQLNYRRDEIEQVFNNLTKDEIDLITKKEVKIDNLVDYINNDYFNITTLDRYLQYKQENSSYNYDEVISRVNMMLDFPFYENISYISNPSDISVIVNKYYKLPNDYVPKGLVKIDAKYAYYDQPFYTIPIVKEHFQQMADDMKKNGLTIKVTSIYRSYQTQKNLYNNYLKNRGVDYTEAYSARPGHSEHQTGLAVDVKSPGSDSFEKSKEYVWLNENAYKYGFIVRYPKDKEDITGYNFESWHYRYVGKDLAKYIYDNNLTLDEYYAMTKNKKTNK